MFKQNFFCAIFRTIKIRPANNGSIHPCKPVIENVTLIVKSKINFYFY